MLRIIILLPVPPQSTFILLFPVPQTPPQNDALTTAHIDSRINMRPFENQIRSFLFWHLKPSKIWPQVNLSKLSPFQKWILPILVIRYSQTNRRLFLLPRLAYSDTSTLTALSKQTPFLGKWCLSGELTASCLPSVKLPSYYFSLEHWSSRLRTIFLKPCNTAVAINR